MTTKTPPTMSRNEMIGALVADKFAALLDLEDQDFHDCETVHGRSDRGEENTSTTSQRLGQQDDVTWRI